MTRQVLQILFVFSLILVIVRCAQVVPLSGGKRDEAPPKMLEAVPAAKTTNFNSEVITLRFDEFVQVKDLTNQLIVTPRLKSTPDISADGKKILVKLKKEELAPNTTYRIYFGKAIADMNESNSIQDFEYVFSTGTFIDTLKIKGDVIDAFTNKPVSDVLIALYNSEKANDSLPYKTEPDYIARSSDNGAFSITNLPYRSFLLYAFADKNKNNLYDGDAERIAFLGSSLKLISDTTIRLKLFQEEASKSFIKKTLSPYYGFSQIVLNKKAKVQLSSLKPADLSNLSETSVGQEKDTVSFYYKNATDTLGIVLENLSINKTDTLKLTLPRLSAKRKLKAYTINTIGNKLALYDKLRFNFLTWMDTTRSDLSKIKFSSKEDSLISEVPVKGRWTGITVYEIDHKLKEGVSYTLKVDTSAFFDLKQITNDSSMVNFTTQSKIEFGKLTLKLLFDQKQDYVVQLINEQEKVVREQTVALSLSDSNAVTLEFIDVLPAVYTTKIIFDDNKNKKWDSGNILRKQQPEKVIINSKQLKVLSDWEIEEEILIKE
ncbi:hypothetical protein CNR22_10980 [Sphingobacteriaceae bacterium]|nr:hypothetical protein CNR22_10980 [Sphingobacteriaceae bacterium]